LLRHAARGPSAGHLGEPGLATDEIQAYVNPVVVGSGKPMFAKLDGPLELKLLGVQTFSGGVVQLRYAPRAGPSR
jgi:dihydrofolate reductase